MFGDAYDDHSDPRWIAPWLEARAYLGGGATSRVYEGYDHRAGREVAIKVARAGLDARTVQRLGREVTALEAVHHEHVVGVLGHGRLEDGRPFVIMQRVRARSRRATQATSTRGSSPDARRRSSEMSSLRLA